MKCQLKVGLNYLQHIFLNSSVKRGSRGGGGRVINMLRNQRTGITLNAQFKSQQKRMEDNKTKNRGIKQKRVTNIITIDSIVPIITLSLV